MSLPNQEEIDAVLAARPGDEIYQKVKPLVDQANLEEKEVREKLIALILPDLVIDFAVANSCDEIGKVLNYLSEERGILNPEFIGDILMKDFSRISKLKISLNFAKMIGLEGDVLDLMLKAEIERLWGQKPKPSVTLLKDGKTSPISLEDVNNGVKKGK
jgi:hypothetical protein